MESNHCKINLNRCEFGFKKRTIQRFFTKLIYLLRNNEIFLKLSHNKYEINVLTI